MSDRRVMGVIYLVAPILLCKRGKTDKLPPHAGVWQKDHELSQMDGYEAMLVRWGF